MDASSPGRRIDAIVTEIPMVDQCSVFLLWPMAGTCFPAEEHLPTLVYQGHFCASDAAGATPAMEKLTFS